MNIIINPLDVKKDIRIVKINKHFEQSKEIKTALFYELTLTHINTNISAKESGYNEMEVMMNCLEKLNKMIITKEFFDKIPCDYITEVVEEINSVAK